MARLAMSSYSRERTYRFLLFVEESATGPASFFLSPLTSIISGFIWSPFARLACFSVINAHEFEALVQAADHQGSAAVVQLHAVPLLFIVHHIQLVLRTYANGPGIKRV